MSNKYYLLFLLLLVVSCTPDKVDDQTAPQEGPLSITSPAFENNGNIPERYTCNGKNINPPMEISGIPEGAKSLVLIMDDPDAPGSTWDHWIFWNLDPSIKEIKGGEMPNLPHGKNSWGRNDYGGPCPPNHEHRYFFKLYALDTKLDLAPGSSKQEVEKAFTGNILEKAELIGKYKRN